MSFRYSLPLVALILIAVAAVQAFFGTSRRLETSRIAEPVTKPLRRGIAALGIIEPLSESIVIGAPTAGLVDQVLVKPGDTVKQGDPLLCLESGHLQATVRICDARLKVARAKLQKLQMMPRPEEIPLKEARIREAEAILRQLTDQWNRTQQLFEKKTVGISDVVRDKEALTVAESQVAHAIADLKLLKSGTWTADAEVACAEVDLAESEVQNAMVEVARRTIRAPIAGTVFRVNVRAGEYIDSTETRLVMGDTSVLHIRTELAEEDIPRFRPGIHAVCYARGCPAQPIPLKFVRTEYYVTSKSVLNRTPNEAADRRVLPVIFEIAEPHTALFVGQHCELFIETE